MKKINIFLGEQKDSKVGAYVVDSQYFSQLSIYEGQLKYQSELLTCFFNQQAEYENDLDSSPNGPKARIETKSMTNLSSDDELNPFLTFLKAKSDKILPSKVTKRQAMEVWANYKKAVNKVIPTLRSHLSSKKCNPTLLLDLMCSFVAGQENSVYDIIDNIENAVAFVVEYMVIYYQTDALSNKSIDMTEIFKFGAYQIIFKDEDVSSKLSNAACNESYLPAKQLGTKYFEILNALKRLPKIGKYFEKTDAQEKAEKLALITEKKGSSDFIIDLLLKSKVFPSVKFRDAYALDILMVRRDSEETSPFLVKGLNLRFRECPYVLLINASDLENRLDNSLSCRDRESFKAILNAICSDMLAAFFILHDFFGDEFICRKLPIMTKVCTVLCDHQASADGKSPRRRTYIGKDQ